MTHARDLSTRAHQPPSPHQTIGETLDRLRTTEFLSRQTNSIYTDDRLLGTDTATVLFNTFPSTLTVLELTWMAALTDGGADSVIYLSFNGDTFASPSADCWWNIAVGNQVGSQPSADSIDDSAGGIGYIAGTKLSWGHVRFPNYPNAAASDPFFVPVWEGEGGWRVAAGGSPDVWTVAGARDSDEAMTAIEIAAHAVSGGAAGTFRAGSRFTLTGY